MIHRIAVIAVIACAFAAPVRAQGPSKSAADTAYADGQRRYAQGDYIGASQRFVAAYALDPDPAYLFNAAQAYRFAKSCTLSADYYRRFLAAAPGAPNKAKVEGYIVEMEACSPKGPEPKPDPVSGALLQQDPARETPGSPQEPPSPGRTQRILGIAAGALGVVAIGLGGYFTYQASSLEDETTKLYESKLPPSVCMVPDDPRCTWTDDNEDEENRLISDGNSAKTRARVSLGVGGVLVVGGLLFYVLAPDREQPQVSITPTTGGAMAFGSFRF